MYPLCTVSDHVCVFMNKSIGLKRTNDKPHTPSFLLHSSTPPPPFPSAPSSSSPPSSSLSSFDHLLPTHPPLIIPPYFPHHPSPVNPSPSTCVSLSPYLVPYPSLLPLVPAICLSLLGRGCTLERGECCVMKAEGEADKMGRGDVGDSLKGGKCRSCVSSLIILS